MRKRIGEFLVEKGLLSASQVSQILEHSQKTGLRFGEAGIELGFLTRDKLVQVFGPGYSFDFFHVDVRYFPKATQDLLPVDLMLKRGVLPLGSKAERSWFRTRQVLNLGMLDPGGPAAAKAIEEVRQAAQGKLGPGTLTVRPFLVLADQFIEVMGQVYGMTETRIRDQAAGHLEPTLAMFVGEPG
jgi:hypothetical protein